MTDVEVIPPLAPTADRAGGGDLDSMHPVDDCVASAVAHFGDGLSQHGWLTLLQRVRTGLATMDANCAQALQHARQTPQGTWEVYGHGQVGAVSIGSFIAEVDHDAYRLSRTLLGRLGLEQYRAGADDIAPDELLLRIPADDQPAWTSMVRDVAAGRPMADLHHRLVDRGAHRSPAITLAGLSHPLPDTGRPIVMGVVITAPLGSRIGRSTAP
ncbi:hypothetical protein [Solicola sp. PLA-1-18]|uniref:hypothetical protein n=1 Tax=Solicola sp. PLA-1-18 TaxID=3380532 RepID=UPI003B8195E0